MTRRSTFSPGIALIWAGVSIGGALIATPAKFQAASLELPTALEIGRVTFLWLGIAEALLCVALICALFMWGGIKWQWAALPILIFAVQRLGLLPILDTRTLRIIAGQTVEPSHLHFVYLILEVAKCLSLLFYGLAGRITTSPSIENGITP